MPHVVFCVTSVFKINRSVGLGFMNELSSLGYVWIENFVGWLTNENGNENESNLAYTFS